MAGDDDLMDGGHADEIGAEGTEGADFGRGFERGTENGEVDAFGEVSALAVSFLAGEGAEGGGVGPGMSKKRWPAPGRVANRGSLGPSGGVVSGEVDVVGDGDEGAGGDSGLMPPAALVTTRVRQPRRPRTRVGKVTWAFVAFIGVDAALHDGDRDAGDSAEDEVAGVALDRGLGKVRDGA